MVGPTIARPGSIEISGTFKLLAAQDFLTTYKYGWKTSYYQNTYDSKNDEVEEEKPNLNSLLTDLEHAEEGECESCAV